MSGNWCLQERDCRTERQESGQQRAQLQSRREDKSKRGIKMVKRNYQIELKGKKIAKAMTKNANVSLKFSLELIREIKGKRVDKAEAFLRRIRKQEEFLPLRVYKKKVAHRR